MSASEEVETCIGAPDCKGTVGWIIDALILIKSLVIIFGNVQGIIWWSRNAKSHFPIAIKVLMVFSIIIVSKSSYNPTDYHHVRLSVWRKEPQTSVHIDGLSLILSLLHLPRLDRVR